MPRQSSSGTSARSFAGAAIVAALLQVGFSSQVSLFGGTFNFMLVLAMLISFSGDPVAAVWGGFFSGLFYDLTSSAPVGLMALLLTLASFAAAHLAHGISVGVNMESGRIALAYALAVNVVNGLALYAMGIETSLLYAVGVHGLACTLLDCVAALPFLLLVGPSLQTGTFSSRGRGGGSSRPMVYATPRHRAAKHDGSGKHVKRSFGSGKRRGTRYKGIR